MDDEGSGKNLIKTDPVEETNMCPSMKRGLSHHISYILLLLIYCMAGFGVLMASNYKLYGLLQPSLKDDKFLTLVGSLGSVMNSLSRFVWGFLLDKVPFKILAFANLALTEILCSTLTLVIGSRALYMTYILTIYFAYGGLYSMMPTISCHIFGRKYGT